MSTGPSPFVVRNGADQDDSGGEEVGRERKFKDGASVLDAKTTSEIRRGDEHCETQTEHNNNNNNNNSNDRVLVSQLEEAVAAGAADRVRSLCERVQFGLPNHLRSLIWSLLLQQPQQQQQQQQQHDDERLSQVKNAFAFGVGTLFLLVLLKDK